MAEMVESTAATQSTEPEPQTGQIAPAVPLFEIRLTAVRSSARVFRSGGITEVQQAQAADIQMDDGIEVVKLEEQEQQSYSILDFADYLEVELFSNTSVFLAGLRQEAGDSTHVTLHLDSGNMFVHLNEQKTTQVTVQTLDTTIKTLTSGTEFDVCHNEELTCVLVKKGVVEITARDKKQIVKAGEAGYVLKDVAPSPPICAPTPVFIAWEGRYRQFVDALALEKVLSELPQEPCPLTVTGLPINARIIYRDEFRNISSRWARGEIDNFMASYVRFSGRRYYQVQAQDPEDQYLAYVPNERDYEDVNIDIRAMSEGANSGDFRYGLVFRRSGDQYYAFIISPVTQTWYFLKSSSTGLETLREGTDERMRGLDAKETLRVETYGSIFLFYINGRFIDWISDPDYASGEVGLFVETLDNPDALIRFDSIIIWNMPPVQNPNQGREYCFNAMDDDGDRLIDRADPDCQRLDLPATSLPQPTNTLTPTRTPKPTRTPRPPGPTGTSMPPTNTPRPPNNPPTNTPGLPIPTILPPLPTILPPLPTILPPLPTILPPILTILPPLPVMPVRTEPPVETPIPE